MSERRHRPLIVPVFIPNQGCPYRCVFCDQERITSQSGFPVDGKHVEKVLFHAVQSKGFDPEREPEVAFYGGTFTCLPLVRVKELLQAVVPFIRRGLFSSIRVSTRPDALGEEHLRIMKESGVLTIELGAQSMDDDVLVSSQRGHTAADTASAVRYLRSKGFKVGIQLMPGLPGDSGKRFHETVTKVLRLKPDMVRLYPALVIKGTKLAKWYEEGLYRPMSLHEAVEVCIESCLRLESEDIPVIRIGLMSSPSLLEEGQIIAGPWHTAFGFLVRSGIYHKCMESQLPRAGEASRIVIYVPEREISLVRGYKNGGLSSIEAKTGAKVMGVEMDDTLPLGRVKIKNV